MRGKKIVLILKNTEISGFNQDLEKSGGLTEKSVYREERIQIGRASDKSGAARRKKSNYYSRLSFILLKHRT